MAGPHPELYGLPASYIARICKVDLATARRWKRGATCPPYTALALLAMDLGAFSVRWKGWKLKRGILVSPEGWEATPGDVLSIQLTQMQLGDYRRENQHLRERMSAYEIPEEQPLPDQWDWQIAAEK